MDTESKIQVLRAAIDTALAPLITNDYWLLEVPYYPNIGDTLIWQGEVDFLRQFNVQCKGMYSYNTPIDYPVEPSDIILLQGGGNFGDVWELPQNFRQQVIERFPDNKIILFPQTVYFQEEANISRCAELYNAHPNVTICARDKASYALLQKYFTNPICLVPDMAFYIDMSRWQPSPITKDKLLLKRTDVEYKSNPILQQLEQEPGMDVSDWVTYERSNIRKRTLRRIKKVLPFLYDWYAQKRFLPYQIALGVQQLSRYDRIYSTRLHAAILSILLRKTDKLTFFDNSYGKNKQFYATWLSDLDGLTFC